MSSDGADSPVTIARMSVVKTGTRYIDPFCFSKTVDNHNASKAGGELWHLAFRGEADLPKGSQLRKKPVEGFNRYKACVLLTAVFSVVFHAFQIALRCHYPDNPVDFGANYGPLTLRGQWWRLLSSQFIHVQFLHLLGNILGLWLMSSRLERVVGSRTFLFIFLFCGTAAGIAVLAADPFSGSYGASAGVAGTAGGWVWIFANDVIRKKDGTRMRKPLAFLLVTLFFGYFVLMALSDLSHQIHAGSLIAGQILTMMFLRFTRTAREIAVLMVSSTAILLF